MHGEAEGVRLVGDGGLHGASFLVDKRKRPEDFSKGRFG
jgi:hypothetical protein